MQYTECAITVDRAGDRDHVHRVRHVRPGRANRPDFATGIPCSWQSSRRWRLARWECCGNRCAAIRRHLHRPRRRARSSSSKSCSSPSSSSCSSAASASTAPLLLGRPRNRIRRHRRRLLPPRSARREPGRGRVRGHGGGDARAAPSRSPSADPSSAGFLHRVIDVRLHALGDDDFVTGQSLRRARLGRLASFRSAGASSRPRPRPRRRRRRRGLRSSVAPSSRQTAAGGLGRRGGLFGLLIAELIGRLVHDVQGLLRFERLRLGRRRLQFVPDRQRHFRFHDRSAAALDGRLRCHCCGRAARRRRMAVKRALPQVAGPRWRQAAAAGAAGAIPKSPAN